jgi:hypothetical protein
VTFKNVPDVDGVLDHVLNGMSGRQEHVAANDTDVVDSLVLAWRQAVREGDRRMATQLLSLAASQKEVCERIQATI